MHVDSGLVDGELSLVNTTATLYDVTTASTNDDAPSMLVRFSRWYSGVHGYLCIAVCMFGIISNILNIVVLTHRRMASSPTNFILTALAISDLLPMLSYVPYAVYFHSVSGLHPDPRYEYPRGWILFMLFHNSFIITSHTVSVWLTVTLAVFRYIAVCHHAVARRVCTLQRARVAAVCIVLAAVIVCLPMYIMYQPHQLPTVTPYTNNTFDLRCKVEVQHNVSQTASLDNCSSKTSPDGRIVSSGYWFEEKGYVGPSYRSVNFWVYGVALKTAPCILLSVLSALLIRAMRAAELRHRRLVQRRQPLSSVAAMSPRADGQSVAVRRHHTFEVQTTPKARCSPAAWRRTFSERISRPGAQSDGAEAIQRGKTSSAGALQDDQPTLRAADAATDSEDRKNSTVIAQTVGGDVVVELTCVDDENLDVTAETSGTNSRDQVAASSHLQVHSVPADNDADEKTHIRAGAQMITPAYNTFDSDEEGGSHEAIIRRLDSRNSSFRQRRSPSSLSRNSRQTVSRRRQADTLSVGDSMRSACSTGPQTSPCSARRRDSTAGAGREHVRTTAMLVAVVLCFVVVELPQGLLAFLSGIDGRIFDDVYVPLGDVWDAAVIVNSAVNFILYCTMSAQFRRTFAEVICRRGQPANGTGTSKTHQPVQQDDDPSLLFRWRLVVRRRTAPMSSFIHYSGVFSAVGRPKPATPV